MKCKANRWTLHSRMEMEELEQLAAPLLTIRENKTVQMEIVCRKYEEEWKFILDFTTAAEARWRVKDSRLMGNGREPTQWGRRRRRGGSQIKGKSGSSSSFSRYAALLTGLENSSLWFTPQHKLTVIEHELRLPRRHIYKTRRVSSSHN